MLVNDLTTGHFIELMKCIYPVVENWGLEGNIINDRYYLSFRFWSDGHSYHFLCRQDKHIYLSEVTNPNNINQIRNVVETKMSYHQEKLIQDKLTEWDVYSNITEQRNKRIEKIMK